MAWCQRDPLRSNQTGTALNVYFPEFNGWHGGTQAQLNVSDISAKSRKIESSNVSIDQYVHKLRSAFGVNYIREAYGSFSNKRLSIYWTPRIKIKKLNLLPTIGYSRSVLNFHFSRNSHNTYFMDSAIGGVNGSNVEYSGNGLASGLGFEYESWYGALNFSTYGTYRVNSIFGYDDGSIRQNTVRVEDIMADRYSLIIGKNFNWNLWQFNQNLLVITDLVSARIQWNMNANYKRFTGGFSYSYTDYVAFGVGYLFGRSYRLSYSTSISTSKIGRRSLILHELGLRVLLFDSPDHRIINNSSIF